MKYIHVARNGLDMAHSANQNQLRFWGSHFVGPSCQVSPYYSLKYWHRVHQRVLEIGESMQARFLLLNFDHLCMNPATGIKTLLKFLEWTVSASQIGELCSLVRVPDSLGGFKRNGIHIFDPADVAFVRKLGFDDSLD
jgi:hypothetical protein